MLPPKGQHPGLQDVAHNAFKSREHPLLRKRGVFVGPCCGSVLSDARGEPDQSSAEN